MAPFIKLITVAFLLSQFFISCGDSNNSVVFPTAPQEQPTNRDPNRSRDEIRSNPLLKIQQIESEMRFFEFKNGGANASSQTLSPKLNYTSKVNVTLALYDIDRYLQKANDLLEKYTDQEKLQSTLKEKIQLAQKVKIELTALTKKYDLDQKGSHDLKRIIRHEGEMKFFKFVKELKANDQHQQFKLEQARRFHSNADYVNAKDELSKYIELIDDFTGNYPATIYFYDVRSLQSKKRLTVQKLNSL